MATRTAQLADATEAAVAARAAAEAASATKATFLASVSHELRTPLTSVVGFTKLVRKRFEEVVEPALAGLPGGGVAADPKLERAVRQIGGNLGIMAAEGERLTAMINDVLDLQKIEAGRMEFRREPVDLLAVVDQSIAATSALFATTGLELRPRGPDTVPPVTGDHHRLIQVVINLLSNAVKFTAAGSVTVRVAVEGGGAGVVVSVSDTGTGIAAADRDRVFEAFAQAGDTVDRQAARDRSRAADLARDRRGARRPAVARERARLGVDVRVPAAGHEWIRGRRGDGGASRLTAGSGPRGPGTPSRRVNPPCDPRVPSRAGGRGAPQPSPARPARARPTARTRPRRRRGRPAWRA